MGTITGYTAQRMKAIEDGTVVGGSVDENGDLILTRFDGVEINAGRAKGDTGPAGGLVGGYQEPINDKGNVSGTVTFNLSAHNVFRINPTGAVTVAFTNPPDAGFISPITIIVGNSSFDITWPAGSKYPNGLAPELYGETWVSIVAFPTYAVIGASLSGVA